MNEAKKQSQIKEVWRRFKKNKPAVIGLIIFVLLCLVAIFGELIVPYDKAIEQDIMIRLQKPSWEYWFGTDGYGRDQFARVIHSAKISLSIGVFASVGGLIIGCIIGACSAMYGQTVVAPACVERVGKMAFKDTIIDEIITLDPVFEENSESE